MRKPKRKTLIKKLDTVFSEYIRRKYADKKGIVSCYTCGKKAYWKGERCRMDTLFQEDHEYLDGMKEIVKFNVTAAM